MYIYLYFNTIFFNEFVTSIFTSGLLANLFPDLFVSKRPGLAVLKKAPSLRVVFYSETFAPNHTMYRQLNKNDHVDRKTHKKCKFMKAVNQNKNSPTSKNCIYTENILKWMIWNNSTSKLLFFISLTIIFFKVWNCLFLDNYILHS